MHIEHYINHDHDGHEAEPLEIIADNAVEKTAWMFCVVCRVEFMSWSTTIVEEES